MMLAEASSKTPSDGDDGIPPSCHLLDCNDARTCATARVEDTPSCSCSAGPFGGSDAEAVKPDASVSRKQLHRSRDWLSEVLERYC
uniref:Extracellular membrane protein CFEM domain-containing protein n=1 Tax=Peronospora matthiolae TaxID=2874970 RepID=A0AAV1T8K5_9STRA